MLCYSSCALKGQQFLRLQALRNISVHSFSYISAKSCALFHAVNKPCCLPVVTVSSR